jgi:hypothetical protein
LVADINLRRIRKAGRLASGEAPVSADNPERSGVLVHIGARVGEGNAVMVVPASVAQRVRLERAFKIEERNPDAEFDLALAQVHDEALRLIRDASPGAYSRIVGVYERFL